MLVARPTEGSHENAAIIVGLCSRGLDFGSQLVFAQAYTCPQGYHLCSASKPGQSACCRGNPDTKTGLRHFPAIAPGPVAGARHERRWSVIGGSGGGDGGDFGGGGGY